MTDRSDMDEMSAWTRTAIALFSSLVICWVVSRWWFESRGERERVRRQKNEKDAIWNFADRFEFVKLKEDRDDDGRENALGDKVAYSRDELGGEDLNDRSKVDILHEARYMWKTWPTSLLCKVAEEHPKPGARCYGMMGLLDRACPLESTDGTIRNDIVKNKQLNASLRRLLDDDALVVREDDVSKQLSKVSEFVEEACDLYGWSIEDQKFVSASARLTMKTNEKSSTSRRYGTRSQMSREELRSDVAALLAGLE